jgi:putative component of toxin-antitoxin plasmid stabilization module
MSKFALVKIEAVFGRISFFKLMIDGKYLFDQFEFMINREGNMEKHLLSTYVIMTRVANGELLPHTKFKDITPKGEKIKEFEIKKGDLRIYLIKEEGHVIILGGKKNSQKEDIRKFRSIKKRYLESKQSKS